MEYMTYNYFNEIYDIYDSKYEAIAVPGRVGMDECSLDLIFFN